MDVDKLINLINKTLSDEWLAYYQYWIGAKRVKGPMKGAVIAELILHATEDFTNELYAKRGVIQMTQPI